MRISYLSSLALLLLLPACDDGPTGLSPGEFAATIHFHQPTSAFILAVSPTTSLDSIRIGPSIGGNSSYVVIGPIRGRYFVYAPDGAGPTVRMRLFMNPTHPVEDVRIRVLEVADSSGVTRTGGAVVTMIR